MAGDVMVLDGRRSVFALGRVDDEALGRTARGEIRPTGPLWGRGLRMVARAARELDFRPGPARRVKLAFSLPPGAYATTVLGELFASDRFRRAS